MFSDSKKTKAPVEGIGNIFLFCLIFDESQIVFLLKGLLKKKKQYMGQGRERKKKREREYDGKSQIFTDNIAMRYI